MLQLSDKDVFLSKQSENETAAIRAIASDLAERDFVESQYVEGMLAREHQNTTFLGNGIAIPHGTTDTRHLVKQTGLVVHHYPSGVDWGQGNTVYLAIGIAAKSDEHLDILKQLTKVLSQDGVEQALKSATGADEILSLLNGSIQLGCEFHSGLIQLDFPASDMLQLSAVAAGLLSNQQVTDKHFVADIIAKSPTHLGKGLWLVASNEGAHQTGLSFVTASQGFSLEGQKVKGLMAIASTSANTAHHSILNVLEKRVIEGNQDTLFALTKDELVALFSSSDEQPPSSSGLTANYTINNTHGLHARPGAMLVAAAKKFESEIRVENLDAKGKTVNAKSLMKVIGLGVKHGHQLKFTAQGPDASQALQSIGSAIEAGLGEK